MCRHMCPCRHGSMMCMYAHDVCIWWVCIHVSANAFAFMYAHACERTWYMSVYGCVYMICGCVCDVWVGWRVHMFESQRTTLYIFMWILNGIQVKLAQQLPFTHKETLRPLCILDNKFSYLLFFFKGFFVLSYVHMRVSVYTPECAVEIRRGYQSWSYRRWKPPNMGPELRSSVSTVYTCSSLLSLLPVPKSILIRRFKTEKNQTELFLSIADTK